AFHRAVEEAFDIRDGDRSSRLHDIGESERERILKRLDECGMRAHRLREAIDRRERLTSELRDVEAKLQSTSDDPAIAELIKRKQDLDEKVGQLENEANALTPHIQELESKLAARKRQIAERQREREA